MGRKLLIITQAVDPADSALGFFCDWMTAFSHDPRFETIEVWCLRQGIWTEKPANITVKVLPTQRRLLVFLKLLVRSRFSAVFVHMSPLWVVLGGWWWRLTGQRVVLWYTHGTGSRMLRAAMFFAQQVLTATRGAFPFPSRKVTAIGHGISAAFARQARTPHDQLRFLGVGRLTPRKRVLETLHFFAALSEQDRNARLEWIGEALTAADHQYVEQVRTEISRLGLTDRFILQGKIAFADLPARYASADLLVHLSATGSLDKVVLEALAAGCAVFSTNPATAEVATDMFWPGSLNAQAVTEVFRRARMGVAPETRRLIAEKFSVAQVCVRILAALAQ